MDDIAASKYVRLTTYTNDGREKHAPVWIADLGDGTVGFTTGPNSWKVKRITNTLQVELCECNARGVPAESPTVVSGTAEVVNGPGYEAVAAAIKAKYGFQVQLVKVVNALAGVFGNKREPSSCAVVITLTS